MKHKKISFIILASVAFLVLMCTSCFKTGSEYFDISDGFVDEYVFEKPYEEFVHVMKLDGFCFAHEQENILDIKDAVSQKGYIVDAKEINNETKLTVSIHNGLKKVALFTINEYGTNPHKGRNWYEVTQLVIGRGGCKFPFPFHMLEFVSGLPFYSPIDKDNFDDYLLTVNCYVSFDDLVEFYESSLTRVIDVDKEKNKIIISGIDLKKGTGLNSIVELEYYSVTKNTNQVRYKRLKEYN